MAGRVLRIFVGQLRNKIEPLPSTPRYIIYEPWVATLLTSPANDL
jgi:hypothetical protein